MNPMVERVARALCRTSTQAEDMWLAYVHPARAALAAMREPTEAMLAAGHDQRSDPKTGLSTLCGIDEIYTAMIDAALKDD